MLFTKIMYMGFLALVASAAAVVLPGQLSPPLPPTVTSGELSPASASLSLSLLVSTQVAAAPVIPPFIGVVASEYTTLATTITSATWASASPSPAVLVSTQAAPAPVTSQSTGITASESTTPATVTSATWASANFTLHNNLTIDAVPGAGWATFYNDNKCTVKGGEAVSISNPGCPGERGRNSIYIQAGMDQIATIYSLVLTPGGGCNCQVECITEFLAGQEKNFCFDLNGNKDAESFRFIKGGCGKNNC